MRNLDILKEMVLYISMYYNGEYLITRSKHLKKDESTQLNRSCAFIFSSVFETGDQTLALVFDYITTPKIVRSWQSTM